MKIIGREIRFMCTVEAHDKISALAEDNNINTVMKKLQGDGDTVELYTTAVLFTVAMSEGYESHAAWENPEYIPNPLTMDECHHLLRKDFDQLYSEAVDAFMHDVGVSVEAEAPKGKKAEAGASESG